MHRDDVYFWYYLIVIDSRNPGTVGLEKDEKLITQEGACVENIRETGKIDKERKVQKKMLIQEKLVNSEKKLAEQIETKKGEETPIPCYDWESKESFGKAGTWDQKIEQGYWKETR